VGHIRRLDLGGGSFLEYRGGAQPKFVAICGKHEADAHGKRCQREASALEGKRKGLGRPLGMLLAWLEVADGCGSRAVYVKRRKFAFSTRSEARNWLANMRSDVAVRLLEKERPARDGESAEPERAC